MEEIEKVTTGFSRNRLDELFAQDYSPENLIALFSNLSVQVDGETIYLYRSSVQVGVLTLSEHSLRVLQQFETYFAHRSLFGIDLNFFRLVLAIHDIGKPLGGVYGQHEYTNIIAHAILQHFKYPEASIRFALALLSADPIGYHLRGDQSHKDLTVVAKVIRDMADDSGLPLETFFELLMIYYTVDASSYDFLDYLFVPNKETREMGYAPEIATRIQNIRSAVFQTV